LHARLVSFGQIEIDGQLCGHDVVVESDHVRRRKKGPSGMEIIAQPTAKACKLLDGTDTGDVAAILHVTC
jgi:hypothetical protein